jgi:SAM-dependent methyltransferase
MSIEFTGERIVPGLVDEDLWNEHFARYAFAARLCGGRRVLDIACGTGYGSHALAAEARSVVGLDVAADAVAYAARSYRLPNVSWLSGSGTSLPFRESSFDVVVAFEVIEHLHDWERLITEARRVLTPDGVFVVSTPNKNFYAETREQSGPNPFHEHEFEYAEFGDALRGTFPEVQIVLENHAGCLLFESAGPGATAVIEGTSDPSDANFFIAICSTRVIEAPAFVYVPKAANLLKERGLHIRKLEAQLDEERRERARIVALHTAKTEELRTSNKWAQDLDAELKTAYERIVQLQEDLESRTRWALNSDAELKRCVELLDTAEATVVERTNWALALQERISAAQASRWIRLGRMIKIGPELD